MLISMKIKRIILGKEEEFELTPDELYAAYREQEFKFDRSDIEDYFAAFEKEDIEEEYGMTIAELEGKYDDMAYEMRRNIDKYGMDWSYARDDAITVLRRR